MADSRALSRIPLGLSRFWSIGIFAASQFFASGGVAQTVQTAYLGAAVTVQAPYSSTINPLEQTALLLTLSNSNTVSPVTAVALAKTYLPGTFPDGLKFTSPPTLSCFDAAGAPVTAAGTLSSGQDATGYFVQLSGGQIPVAANGNFGSCNITMPVTAGTSTGTSQAYTFVVASGAVTGLINTTPQANAGAPQQSITVKSIAKPAVSQSLPDGATLVLGGASKRLKIHLSNSNGIAIPNYTLTDTFPLINGIPAFKVAPVPNIIASCNNGGAAPVFSALPGDVALTANGTIPAKTGTTNGDCDITVSVVANTTGTAYQQSVVNSIDRIADFSNDIGIPLVANSNRTLRMRSPFRLSVNFANSRLATGQSDTMKIVLFNDGGTPLNMASFTDSPIQGAAIAGNGLVVNSINPVVCTGTGAAAGTFGITAGNKGVTQTSPTTIGANGSCTITVNYTGYVLTAGVQQLYTNTIAAADIAVSTTIGGSAVVTEGGSSSVEVGDDVRIYLTSSPASAAPGNPIKYRLQIENFNATSIGPMSITNTLPTGVSVLNGPVTINGTTNDYTPVLSGGTGCSGLVDNSVTGSSLVTQTFTSVPARVNKNQPSSCYITYWAMSPVVPATVSNSLAIGDVCHGATCNATASNSVVTGIGGRLALVKSFTPATLSEGAISTVRLDISNGTANTITGLSISDLLPASGTSQMVLANPVNAASNCGTPTFTATPGGTSIGLNGGTVPPRASNGTGANGSCFVQFDISGAAGSFSNTATASATAYFADASTTEVVVAQSSANMIFNPALTASKVFSPAAVLSGGSSTVTIRLGNIGNSVLTGVGAIDTLPTGMVFAPTPNAYATCDGAPAISITGNTLSMTGATLPAGGQCDLKFDVSVSGAGNWINTIPVGGITADGGVKNLVPVSATLAQTITNSQLTISEQITPSTVAFPGAPATLSITITNGNGGAGDIPVSGLDLTDYFTSDGAPLTGANSYTDLFIADTPLASTTCTGGVVSATPGGKSLTLSGASMTATSSCQVFVDVVVGVAGTSVNDIIPAQAIVTNEGLTNPVLASTSITTLNNLGVNLTFTPKVIPAGTRSRLRLTVTNPLTSPVANLSTLDILPAGVTVPGSPNPVTTCTGGTISTPNPSEIRLTGGAIAAASAGIPGTCYIEIDVTAPVAGTYPDTVAVGDVTGVSGGLPVSNFSPASDTLRAVAPLNVQIANIGATLDPVVQAGSGFSTGTGYSTAGTSEILKIRIVNPNNAALTGVTFQTPLPAGLFLTPVPNGATSCTGGSVTADPSGTFLRLTGGTMAANSACEVTANILSNIPGSYITTINSGDVTTLEGISNLEPTRAKLVIATPPTVGLEFDLPVIPVSGISVAKVTLGNPNSFPITLTSPLVFTLPSAPGPLVVAPAPGVSSTCTSILATTISAVSGANTITVPSGATLPSGGCTIGTNVTGTVTGTYNGNIPAGDLKTTAGVNPAPANSPLQISNKGFIAGKVFADNDVIPDGIFTAGLDTPFSGVEVQLRNGATCAGTLQTSILTDAGGNYLFHPLPAGTYSVCEVGQPANTYNGIPMAGPIVQATGTAGVASNPPAGPFASVIEGITLQANLAGDIAGSPSNTFAEPYLSAISGKVFFDQNNNGLQNGGDTALAGVAVELHAAANCVTDPAPVSTTTAPDGSYAFTGLKNGTYSVCEPVQPAGTSNGITTAGTVPNGGTPGIASAPAILPSNIANITLPPNTVSPDNNFAEIANDRRISGEVFFDFADDGIRNGFDYGIGAQSIVLSGTDVNGTPVSATTTTDSNGQFTFATLPAGTYTLTQPAQPANTVNGFTTAGSTGGVATAKATVPSAISTIDLTGINTVSGANLFAEAPTPAPDLVVAITHTPAAFSENNNFGKYYVQISNIGPVNTGGPISVKTTLPAGITPTGATGTGWTCSLTGQIVTCNSTAVVTGAGGTGSPIVIDTLTGAGLNGQILTATTVVAGGNEPVAFTGNNTDNDPTVITASASVQGTIWRDYNHDNIRDITEPVVSGWTVELLLNGSVVASAQTTPAGTYAITGIAPGTGYEIRFRDGPTGAIFGTPVPNETGGAFVNGVIDPINNPGGASNTQGTLTGLTLLAGTNTVQQSLPLDPNGVVYDSITRTPVAGAVISISGPAGFSAADVVGGSLSYTTAADGYYQFLLLNTAPSGVYRLSITSYPPGYMPVPSLIIPVCAGTLAVTALPDPALVQTTNLAPTSTTLANPATCATTSAGLATGAATTQYFDSFNLTVGTSAQIVNNHFPIDPVLEGSFLATKTTPVKTTNIGALVPYTVTVQNTLPATLNGMAIVDRIPAGFVYKSGSATLDGVPVEPVITGRTLTWGGLTFAASQTRTVRLMLVVGAGAGIGEYTNEAWSVLTIINTTLSNIARASVIVAPDPVFDCSDIIGKVFNDTNGNGVQDPGEKGLAGVKLATVNGTVITTDEFGRYHVPCAAVPNSDHGSNFILKLDETTLPTGTRMTTDNPGLVRVTRGKAARVNFGATTYRMVRIDLFPQAFVDGTTTAVSRLGNAMTNLPQTLCEAPSSVLLVHVGQDPLAQQRLDLLRADLLRQWQKTGCGYPLSVYTKIIDAPLAVKGLK